jgi:fatty acid desaturase
MTRLAKDGTALVLTALAVGVYLANHYAWNVYLVGDSNRWAIGAIAILGMLACGMGATQERAALMTLLLSAIGIAALVFVIVGLANGSQTMLALLTLATVVLWAASTLRHLLEQRPHLPHRLAHG